MAGFAGAARAVLSDEMALHGSFGASWGVTPSELATERAAPTTRAYTGFLLGTAAVGDFAELAGALLPCMWGYSELGRRLSEEGPRADNPYASWIDLYASDEFAGLAEWCRGVVDEVATDLGPAGRARMREAFLLSSRHELAFWEMAWRLEPPEPGEASSAPREPPSS